MVCLGLKCANWKMILFKYFVEYLSIAVDGAVQGKSFVCSLVNLLWSGVVMCRLLY